MTWEPCATPSRAGGARQKQLYTDFHWLEEGAGGGPPLLMGPTTPRALPGPRAPPLSASSGGGGNGWGPVASAPPPVPGYAPSQQPGAYPAYVTGSAGGRAPPPTPPQQSLSADEVRELEAALGVSAGALLAENARAEEALRTGAQPAARASGGAGDLRRQASQQRSYQQQQQVQRQRQVVPQAPRADMVRPGAAPSVPPPVSNSFFTPSHGVICSPPDSHHRAAAACERGYNGPPPPPRRPRGAVAARQRPPGRRGRTWWRGRG